MRLSLILISLAVLAASACFGIRWLARSPAPEEPGARSPQALKIYVTEEGIYELTAASLEAAGFSLTGLEGSQFQLSFQGRSQPVWVSGGGKELVLRFYGQVSRSPYTRQNVYWLAAGEAALPVVDVPLDTEPASDLGGEVSMALPSATYLETARLEQNILYNPQVEAGENWLWFSIPAPKTETVEANLQALAGGPGRLRLMLWASTQAEQNPDHHVCLRVNGQPVVDETWDGKGRRLIQAALPAGVLVEGSNRIEIEMPGDTGVVADITFVDWLEIDYPRRLAAEADRLGFDSPGGVHMLEGLSEPAVVYDVTIPEAAAPLSTGDLPGYSFHGQAGHRYWAVGPQGYRTPERLALAITSPDLRRSGSNADYVAVGPPDLLEPLQPLLDWRAGQGLQVLSVPLEAVYDQFNGGMPDPEALRAFMRFAQQNWQLAPHYLLLVGDATYDPLGYQAPPEANRLPVFLVPTVFGGQTASDLGFAQLDGARWPPASRSGTLRLDLAVGRIPARSPKQVAALVEKVLRFERTSSGEAWRRRVLAVADGQDPVFRTDAQAFLDLFSAGIQTELLAPQPGTSAPNQQVRDRINQGDLLVAYFGHGSINMWGKDKLFTTTDAQALSNGDRLPVVLNMTCLTGLFTHPKVESLAETLLWHPGGGAVAVLAPTSLTLPNDQSFLSHPLVQAFLDDPQATLGDVLLRARQQVPVDSPGTLDVLQTFLLFGDPALRLQLQDP